MGYDTWIHAKKNYCTILFNLAVMCHRHLPNTEISQLLRCLRWTCQTYFPWQTYMCNFFAASGYRLPKNLPWQPLLASAETKILVSLLQVTMPAKLNEMVQYSLWYPPRRFCLWSAASARWKPRDYSNRFWDMCKGWRGPRGQGRASWWCLIQKLSLPQKPPRYSYLQVCKICLTYWITLR